MTRSAAAELSVWDLTTGEPISNLYVEGWTGDVRTAVVDGRTVAFDVVECFELGTASRWWAETDGTFGPAGSGSRCHRTACRRTARRRTSSGEARFEARLTS
ncbi:hypothetical protein JCM9533A_85940 [Catenuloplanes niger JCM 9533]